MGIAVVSSTPERTILRAKRENWLKLAKRMDVVNPALAEMIRQQIGMRSGDVAQVVVSGRAASMLMREVGGM